jgi:hypothetical protein
MIAWSTIAYGAALSALLAAVVVGLAARTNRVSAALAAAIGAAVGPICWNAILHATHASTFFTDAPIRLMPASWQDTGSGVFALAATMLILGFGPLRGQPAHRAVTLSLIAGVCAFLVDVYLY